MAHRAALQKRCERGAGEREQRAGGDEAHRFHEAHARESCKRRATLHVERADRLSAELGREAAVRSGKLSSSPRDTRRPI
jgi:hypothetical protein